MAIVSLNVIGAAMSKAGSVTLAGITENAYTRTHAGSGYDRVNPFQVENGYAPSEWVAPHSLNDWHGYSHTTVNSGTVLEVGGAYGGATAIWALPAGYSRDTGNFAQRIYYKSMGTSQDLSVNPFAAGGSNNAVGDATTYSITGLTTGNHYAVGVKVEWNDSVSIHTNADSLGYNTKSGETPLTGAGRGVASGEIFSRTPTIGSPYQDPTEQNCFGGATVTMYVPVTGQGSSTMTLYKSTSSGASWPSGWTALSTISAGNGSTANVNAGTTSTGAQWYFRVFYNDIGNTEYATASQYFDCNQGL